MRITQLTYLLFFVGTFLFVSCQTATLHDARAQYLRGEYFAASQTYRNVYRNTKPDERPLRGVIAYEMAETYRRLNYSARAATAYANAIRYNYPDTLMYLRYAQMLHKEGKYAQAQTAYADFLSMDSLNFLALNGLRGARDAEVWRKTPTRYSVKRMDVLNSNRAEFSPMLAENDAVLYFASSRNDARGDAVNSVTGMKNNDFFLAKKTTKVRGKKPKYWIGNSILNLMKALHPLLQMNKQCITRLAPSAKIKRQPPKFTHPKKWVAAGLRDNCLKW